jgi:SAM-dependent methyltransferase
MRIQAGWNFRKGQEGIKNTFDMALQAERERIQQQHLRLEEGIKNTFDMALQAERERIQQQHLRLEEGIKNTFDVMGQNRIADHKTIVAVRTELLEALVRSRLALRLRLDSSASAAPRMRPPLAIEEVRGRLAGAAPLNWKMYVDCLGRGADSYKSFPPGSCSTAAHAEADLFRAFLRPYLRGLVLDVGCGPQPLPWYLTGYPLDLISGIDPISKPDDHAFHFVPGFGESLPWEDEQFDLVISGTTLDHYYLLDVGLREVFRVLRPRGHFAAWIAEFAGAPPYNPYDRPLEEPYDPEHLYHIDRAWLLPLIANAGFVTTEILHFELPFNYLFMSFEKPPRGAAERETQNTPSSSSTPL